MQLDKQQIGLDLEKYSEVFYHFWNYCNAEFTTEIPTAAVSFDKTGNCLKMSINPDFWAQKTYNQQLFTLCHEMLHVYYRHGSKVKSLIKEMRADLMKIANVAMDLCVNRNLTTSFGFNRSEIDPDNMFCWIDTVFPDKNEDPDKYFEYYYNKIKDNAKVIKIATGKSGGNNLVDSHDGLGELGDEEIDGILKEIAKKVHPDNAKDFIDKADKNGEPEKASKKAGTEAGNNVLKVRAEYKIKRKWESIIRKWAIKASSDFDSDNWIRPNRRTMGLDMGGLLLPADTFYEGKDAEKIRIAFFMDVSGSTFHLAQRFFSAARSVPLDKFIVDLYQFDTVVSEVKNDEVTGGGGTSYRIISDFLNKQELEGKSYPLSVWIITDSYGDTVNPKYPERWHWFLTEDANMNYLPKNCNYYKLSDFE